MDENAAECVAQSLESHEVWIPLEAVLPGPDPRTSVLPAGHRPIGTFLLALPPFALLPPKEQEAAESSGFSWSEDPPGNMHDDASSAGESTRIWTPQSKCLFQLLMYWTSTPEVARGGKLRLVALHGALSFQSITVTDLG